MQYIADEDDEQKEALEKLLHDVKKRDKVSIFIILLKHFFPKLDESVRNRYARALDYAYQKDWFVSEFFFECKKRGVQKIAEKCTGRKAKEPNKIINPKWKLQPSQINPALKIKDIIKATIENAEPEPEIESAGAGIGNFYALAMQVLKRKPPISNSLAKQLALRKSEGVIIFKKSSGGKYKMQPIYDKKLFDTLMQERGQALHRIFNS